MILLNQGRGTYSNKGQLNLSVNKINSIVDISKILLISKSSLLSPNSSKIFVTVESLCIEMVTLTWFILWKRDSLAQWWLWQWRRKWVFVSISWPLQHIWDTQSWKLSLNLWSPKWLTPSRHLVSNFNPLLSLIL